MPQCTVFGSSSQPQTVPPIVYRIRMAESIKRTLVGNVLALLRKKTGNLALDERKAVTALVHLKVQTGNAQRLMLDEKSDVRLKTIVEVAEKLGVRPCDLLSPDRGTSARSDDAAINLSQALPVVLDAIGAASERGRLRTAMVALIEDDAPEYRAMVERLLSAPEPWDVGVHGDRRSGAGRRANDKKGGLAE